MVAMWKLIHAEIHYYELILTHFVLFLNFKKRKESIVSCVLQILFRGASEFEEHLSHKSSGVQPEQAKALVGLEAARQ